jgi:hypothetical protein
MLFRVVRSMVRLLKLRTRSKGQIVSGRVVPVDAAFVDRHRSNDAPRGSVPCHGVRTRLLGQGPGRILRHSRPELAVQQTGNKDRSAATGGKGKSQARATEGDGVDGSAVHGIPSSDNDPGHQPVLVVVNETAHEVCRNLHGGLAPRVETAQFDSIRFDSIVVM